MKRTNQQSRALHLYFGMVAEALNDAGYDLRKTLKPSFEIPWTPELVKEYLWGSVMKVVVGKEHTSEMGTRDIDRVWEVLNRHLGEKFGIHEPFPSIETLSKTNEV